MDWEATFRVWARSPSLTELAKADNAETAVRNAITRSSLFQNRNVRVFTQGSYRNRTNISAESDVDVGVLCTDTFFYQLPEGFTPNYFGIITPAPYQHADYKTHVHSALNSHFGQQAVTRGNKAFDIHQNTYRIDADVVPCFEYRQYNQNGTYNEGTSFLSDNGVLVVNWPEHHYRSGISKNSSTGERFKAITRVLKNLRVKMADEGIEAAKPIPSYLIECLVWNVPSTSLNNATYMQDMRSALAYLFNNTRLPLDCALWFEVNEVKYLFGTHQPWTFTQAHNFISAAWDYLGFE